MWCGESSQDAYEDLVCGNPAQDATKSNTRFENAQDVQDANLTSLASGCKAKASDAPYIFADKVHGTGTIWKQHILALYSLGAHQNVLFATKNVLYKLRSR